MVYNLFSKDLTVLLFFTSAESSFQSLIVLTLKVGPPSVFFLTMEHWKLKLEKRVDPLSSFVPFFEQKNSRTFQGLLRTHFPFFQDSIQCKKEPWGLCLFLVLPGTIWEILSRRSFCVCSFSFAVLLKL